MPSAPQHLQEKWKNDVVARCYLIAGGYELTRGWEWTHPDYTLDEVPDQDYEAMIYLVREWDYGGYAGKSAVN